MDCMENDLERSMQLKREEDPESSHYHFRVPNFHRSDKDALGENSDKPPSLAAQQCGLRP